MLWPSTLESATRLANIANWSLIGSLAVGVISTVIIYLMANEKEAYWDRERRQSEERVAQLGLETAQANARASEATEIAERERLARVKIEQEMLKQLRPRGFSKQQFDDLVSALKGKVNKKLSVHTLTDDEAARFGLTIMEALTKAEVNYDWIRPTSEKNVFFVQGVPSTGLTLYVADVRRDPEAKGFVRTLSDAFAKSGVPIGAFMPEQALPDVPSPSLFVAKQQQPFSWFPEHVAPPDLPRPPWEPK